MSWIGGPLLDSWPERYTLCRKVRLLVENPKITKRCKRARAPKISQNVISVSWIENPLFETLPEIAIPYKGKSNCWARIQKSRNVAREPGHLSFPKIWYRCPESKNLCLSAWQKMSQIGRNAPFWAKILHFWRKGPLLGENSKDTPFWAKMAPFGPKMSNTSI